MRPQRRLGRGRASAPDGVTMCSAVVPAAVATGRADGSARSTPVAVADADAGRTVVALTACDVKVLTGSGPVGSSFHGAGAAIGAPGTWSGRVIAHTSMSS